jgi:hypothetical protein
VTGEALQDSVQLRSLRPGQWSEELLLRRLDRALCLFEAPMPCGGELDEVPSAIGGVSRANDQAVGLECVEQADEIAGVDPERRAQLLLRERARLPEVMEDGELVGSQVEPGEGLADPVAGRTGKSEEQQGAAGRAVGGPACAPLLGDPGTRG